MNRILTCCIGALGAALLGACGDSTPTGPDNSITVTGTLVDEYGTPIVSWDVLIPGHAFAPTDAQGRFSVTKVRQPYDLNVVIPSGTNAVLEVLTYVGLTRQDPVIVTPPLPFSDAPRDAYFWGSLYGGAAWPLPQNLQTSVYFESPDAQWVASAGYDHYTLQPSWLGQANTSGSLHALQWQFDATSGVPLAYTGYGNTPMNLADGAYLEGPSVTMATTVPSGTMTGTVSVPSGFAVSRKTVRLGFLPPPLDPAWGVIVDSANATSFSYVTPDLPGATFSIAARAIAPDSASSEIVKTGLSANATDVALAVPLPPTLESPPNAASDVLMTTKFSWSRVTGAVYLVAIRYASDALIYPAPPSYYIFTTDTTVTLADFIPGPWSPYPGLPYVWEVRSWAPVSRVDDITVPTWFGLRGDRSSTVSASHAFSWTR